MLGAGALALQQERQEGQEAHAHAAVEGAGGDQCHQARSAAGLVGAAGFLAGLVVGLGPRHQQPQREGGGNAEHTEQGGVGLPGDVHQRQTGEPWDDGLADIAGEVVLGQGLFDPATAVIGIRDQGRGQGVLGAGPQAADHQGQQQQGDVGGLRGQQVGETGQGGAPDQQGLPAPSARAPAGQQLEAGHHPGIGAAQQADLGIAEAEGRLPDWQQHIDHIGEAVVHAMGEAARGQGLTAGGLVGAIRFVEFFQGDVLTHRLLAVLVSNPGRKPRGAVRCAGCRVGDAGRGGYSYLPKAGV